MRVDFRAGFGVAAGMAAFALAVPVAAIAPVGDPTAGLQALHDTNLIILGDRRDGQLERDLMAASRALQRMRSATTMVERGGSRGRLVLRGSSDGSGLSVFDLTDEIFSFREISLMLDDMRDMVVINVAGSDRHGWDGRLTGSFSAAAGNIIWNFSGFESLTFGSEFYGSVLAPDADFASMAQLTGSVAVRKMEMGGKIIPTAFQRDLQGGYQGPGNLARMVAPDAGVVPEPQTWVMLIAGFAFVGLLMRRRAKLMRPPMFYG